MKFQSSHTEDQIMEGLKEALLQYDEEGEDCVSNITDFRAAQVLTNDVGFILKMVDDSVFHITIQKQ